MSEQSSLPSCKQPSCPPCTQPKKVSKRKSTPTLFGMELAPSQPRTRYKRPTHKHASSPERQRGIALLMVLFLLVMATTITIDLQFDSRVQLQLAANSRNNLQAEYLARSAVQFTHLLLSFDTNFQRMKKQFGRFMAMAPPQVKILLNRLQIWKVVPVDCGLLKQVFGGAFGNRQENSEDGPKGKDGGKLYPFGDFKGNCRSKLSDESSKINLNRFSNAREAQRLFMHLSNLFAARKYDPLFENPRADGRHVTRKEQVAAFQDWVDINNQVAGENGNSEDSKYNYKDQGYITKNSYFDSLQEIRLVYGVDDIFFREFAQFFTVYGRATININNAPKEVLGTLIQTYGIPQKPFTKAVFLQPEYQRFLDALITYRSYLGFPDLKTFVNWAARPVAFPAGLPASATQGQTNSLQGDLPKFKLNFRGEEYKIKTNADTFRLTAEGQVGTVRRRIEAVIHVTPRGARVTQYWRIY